MAVPATVCYFTLYDNLNQSIRKKFGQMAVCSMVAGGIARGSFFMTFDEVNLRTAGD